MNVSEIDRDIGILRVYYLFPKTRMSLDLFHMKLTKSYCLRYRKASKKEKTKLLNEYCKTAGLFRKAAIKRLSRTKVLPEKPKVLRPQRVRGRKRIYLSFHTSAIHKAWELAGNICAEKLQPMLGEYLRDIAATRGLTLSEDDHVLLAQIPLISLKRILSEFEEVVYARLHKIKRHAGTPALYKQIPISAKFGKRNNEKPGLFEVDYVEHKSGVNRGRFAITGTYNDIVSGWTVRASGWGTNLQSIRSIHEKASKRIYHAVREYHPDNAPALLRCLFTEVQETGIARKRKTLTISRSRPYEKNDNAHVEQKNDDKVRKLTGYHRYDTQEQVDILNKIYQICDMIDNFFIACAKLKKVVKKKDGKIVRRIHDKPQTPYQRLMNDPKVNKTTKTKLMRIKKSLSMVRLVEEKNTLLKKLFETIG